MLEWRTVTLRDGSALRRLERRASLALLVFAMLAAGGTYLAGTLPRAAPVNVIGASPRATGAARYGDSLVVAQAVTAGRRWTDPVPARVRVNERLAAQVGAPIRGRVNRILVESGELVRAGQPLFSIIGPDVPGLSAKLRQVEVELSAARTVEKRVSALARAEALPTKEEVAARYALTRAELAHRAASARIQPWTISKGTPGELIVKSPVAGVVLEKNLLSGQSVDAGQGGLMVVADVSTVWIVADLLELHSHSIFAGTVARVTVSWGSKEPREATVDAISPVVDPDRHSVWVRLVLDNRDRRLRPNAVAHVQFLTDAPPTSVEIPASAVRSQGSGHYVFARDGEGPFTRRWVVAGATREGQTLVTGGIAPGDLVVSRGAMLLDNDISLND